MKKLTAYCLAALGLLLTAACSGSDPEDNSGTDGKKSDPVTITLNIGTQGGQTRTSSTTEWRAAAVGGEKMSNWFVIIAQNGKIVTTISNKLASSSKPLEEEEYGSVTLDAAGTYDFYSFANMQPSDIGLTSTAKGTDISGLDTKTFEVDGNGFDVSSKFIPMSNKQTVPVTDKKNVDLWVVRMLAKIELQIKNNTGCDVKLSSITLSDLTQNTNGNLKLMPNPVDKGSEGECEPNLGKVKTGDETYGTATVPFFTSTKNTSGETTPYKYTKAENPVTLTAGATTNVVFYVNESDVPKTDFKQFILTLKTSEKVGDAEGTDVMRYALVSGVSKEKQTWDNTIARNDYHIIPVSLYDYEFRLDVFQSEAIGVLPYWTYTDGIYTINFYNGEEHFHIAPSIKRISTGELLSYGTTAGTWTVDETDSTAGLPKCWQVEGTENTSIFADNTTATHEYDNGGCPRWNTAGHFAFGKFAAQDKTGKSMYTLRVKVNEKVNDGDGNNTAQREYIYKVNINRTNLPETSTGNARRNATMWGWGKMLRN